MRDLFEQMDPDNKIFLCITLYLVISFIIAYLLLSIKGLLFKLDIFIKAWIIRNLY